MEPHQRSVGCLAGWLTGWGASFADTFPQGPSIWGSAGWEVTVGILQRPMAFLESMAFDSQGDHRRADTHRRCISLLTAILWKVQKPWECIAPGQTSKGKRVPTRLGFISCCLPVRSIWKGILITMQSRTTLEEAGDLLSDTVWNFFCLFVPPGLKEFRVSYLRHYG